MFVRLLSSNIVIIISAVGSERVEHVAELCSTFVLLSIDGCIELFNQPLPFELAVKTLASTLGRFADMVRRAALGTLDERCELIGERVVAAGTAKDAAAAKL